MQRHELGGQGHEAEREEREIAHERRHSPQRTAAPRELGRRGAGCGLRPRGMSSGRRGAVWLCGMSTALVWFRRDLRVHDHPPLTAAHGAAEAVVPVFVLDPRLLDAGRFPSANRAWYLLTALHELRAALRDRGGELVVRAGRPEQVLPALARETGAEAVYLASDVSPFAMARDRRVTAALDGIAEVRRTPGNFVADVGVPKTSDGRPFSVFSPFWRAWERLERRDVHGAPRALNVPSGLDRRNAAGGAGARGRRAHGSGGDRRARAPAPLAGRRRRALPRRATTGWRAGPPCSHPTCTSAASPRARSSSGRGPRAARAPRPTSGNSPGATSTRTCCSIIPATRAAPTSRSSTR